MYVFAKDAVDLEVLKVGFHPPADALPQRDAQMVLALVGIPSGGDLASTAVQTNGPVEPAPLLVPVQPVPALMPAPIIIRTTQSRTAPSSTYIEMGFHEIGSALPAPLAAQVDQDGNVDLQEPEAT